MTERFVSWHNHTSYSVLDGASRISDLTDRAAELGMSHLAISDHGNLYGLIEFYKECKAKGIQPILGSEFYHADDRTLREKVSQKDENGVIDGSDKRYYHLSIYARNNTGYHNLIKLSSDAFINGMFYKPRTDNDILAQHSDGLIIGTGCLGGEVLQKLMHHDFDGALAAAARLQEIAGKENMFVEIMNHGLPEQAATNPHLIEIARKLDAPLVATMDSHYVHKEDALAHDALLCCQTHTKLADEKRFRFSNNEYYLKSPEEMRYIFSELPEACDNTFMMAEKVDVTIDFDTLHLPYYAPPEGYESPIQYLTALAQKGLQKRYESVSDEARERLAYELSVIETLGLASYFLIVWDVIKFADRNGIRRGAARGSAAGSLVSYCMNITKVDPLRHGLLFERFLNPSRVALPDIDLDFDTRYRDMLIKYTIDKYGSDRVAQIITFSRILARGAVRDASRVLGLPPSSGGNVAKLMPGLIMGESTPLTACLEFNPRFEAGYNNAEELRQMYASDPQVKEIVDVAKGLEGLVRQDSVHAAAVVITPDKLTNYIPIQKNKDGTIVTQYEKNTIEDLGLLKMDYLGLRNLNVITDTINNIGFDPGVEDTAFDDFDTFQLLRDGKTIGVFQLESSPMRNLLQRLQPNSIDDIAAVVALYRPGPMGSNMHNDYADRKNGRQPITLFHEDAADLLGDTFSLMIYQEQVMKIAQRFAGYSLVEADSLRKIVGKKLRDKMIAEKDRFIQGCRDNNYSAQLAEQLFEMIEHHASYSFNKSHAYGYAYTTYQTAFLKANYPKEYMAALCSSVSDKIEKASVFMNESRAIGLEVLTPDVNDSNVDFAPTDKGIRTGLAAVKSIGPDFAEKIVDARQKDGSYDSLIDFVQRIRPKVNQAEALALSGAFDTFGTRLGVNSVAGDVIVQNRKVSKKIGEGQESLFDSNQMWQVDIPKSEYPPRTLLENERVSIGIYVSGHPLDEYVDRGTGVTINDVEESLPVGEQVKVLVHLTEVEHKFTKAGAKMANLIISDQTGYIEAVCFPYSYGRASYVEGAIGIIGIKIGTDYQGERNYIIQNFSALDEEKDDNDMLDHYVSFYLPHGFAQNAGAVSKLKGILLSHYGNTGVNLHVSPKTKLQLPDDIGVEPSDKLIEEVKNLFSEFSSR